MIAMFCDNADAWWWRKYKKNKQCGKRGIYILWIFRNKDGNRNTSKRMFLYIMFWIKRIVDREGGMKFKNVFSSEKRFDF